jgi:hypothetical protein
MTSLVDTLRQSLSERWRPEQVADAILKTRADRYEPKELALLQKARPSHYWSSMNSTFTAAADMEKQCASAARLFGVEPPRQERETVRAFIDSIRKAIRITDGLDFKKDRLDRKARRRRRLPKGHRAYNKRFRMVARLEKKYATWGAVSEVHELARVAKSRLAFRIESLEEVESACFVAWMAARLNVRSMFTFGKQERAFDEVAEMLLRRVPKRGEWFSVALVHPAPDVLARLSDEERGRLLAEWFAVMRRASAVLERVAKHDKPDLTSMIVRRGNDSSTWNEAAGAFNKARDGWIATLYALGMESSLERFAPGKALRLMAADVAFGHRAYGKGLDPDTVVWGLLPKPWQVMGGKRRCDRGRIEKACAEAKTPHGGWIAPRSQRAVAYKPTPELVHGVVCVDPSLATILKRAGYFGGHGHRTRTAVAISRPFDGEKVGAGWPLMASADVDDYD